MVRYYSFATSGMAYNGQFKIFCHASRWIESLASLFRLYKIKASDLLARSQNVVPYYHLQ